MPSSDRRTDPSPTTARFFEAIDHTPAEAIRILPAGALIGVIGIVGAGKLASALGIESPLALAGLLFAGGVGGFVAGFTSASRIARGTALAVGRAVLPTGRTTPPVADYSREDALLMQRDVAGAVASFEEKIAADPHLVGARLRAADLYAGAAADPRRAAALFREVQRIPGVAARDDIYASNRLVDLYTGPLADPGRAMVELRRLVDRHAGTRAAEDARRGLATLKARSAAAADRGAGD